MARWPRQVYGTGSDPDPRFTLANERTFLAWIRTSGALFALALALEVLDLALTPWVRDVIVVLLAAGSLWGAVGSWLSWARTERALRTDMSLPGGGPYLVLAAFLVLAVALFLIDVAVIRGFGS
ncbi:YidH family protein [Aeromicrobium sp. JJY06]|uniref:YidH family protein n=1 Tax=Aeromicrobium sp. JJY06 TaxID=3373478 RepID=UPI00376EBCCD